MFCDLIVGISRGSRCYVTNVNNFNIPSDFVLCYKKLPNETEEDVDGTDNFNSMEDGKKREHAEKRHLFLKQCEMNGLEFEKQHWKVCLLCSLMSP